MRLVRSCFECLQRLLQNFLLVYIDVYVQIRIHIYEYRQIHRVHVRLRAYVYVYVCFLICLRARVCTRIQCMCYLAPSLSRCLFLLVLFSSSPQHLATRWRQPVFSVQPLSCATPLRALAPLVSFCGWQCCRCRAALTDILPKKINVTTTFRFCGANARARAHVCVCVCVPVGSCV